MWCDMISARSSLSHEQSQGHQIMFMRRSYNRLSQNLLMISEHSDVEAVNRFISTWFATRGGFKLKWSTILSESHCVLRGEIRREPLKNIIFFKICKDYLQHMVMSLNYWHLKIGRENTHTHTQSHSLTHTCTHRHTHSHETSGVSPVIK